MSAGWIAALWRLDAAATPGPWAVRDHYEHGGDLEPGRWLYIASPEGFNVAEEPLANDAALIVAARNALPGLLAIAEAAQGLCELTRSKAWPTVELWHADARLRAALAAVAAETEGEHGAPSADA